MKKITIYDIAKDSGVSLATVSRVINGSDVVKKKTKERVEASILRLGYRPNIMAQSLASNKSTNIALIMPELSSENTHNIINGAIDVSKIYKYNIVLHTFTEGIYDLNDIIDSILKLRVNGVIFYSEKMTTEALKKLESFDIRVLSIGKYNDSNVTEVFIDFNNHIDYIFKKYDPSSSILLLEDHKNIQFSNNLKEYFLARKEELGFKNATTIKMNNQFRSTYLFLKNYFKEHKNHKVIIANRDTQALAILNSAKENGIRVPEDMEIICLQDTKYNSTSRPTISGFKNPYYDLGSLSLRIMTKLMSGDTDIKKIELKSIFCKRGSTL